MPLRSSLEWKELIYGGPRVQELEPHPASGLGYLREKKIYVHYVLMSVNFIPLRQNYINTAIAPSSI